MADFRIIYSFWSVFFRIAVLSYFPLDYGPKLLAPARVLRTRERRKALFKGQGGGKLKGPQHWSDNNWM